jgi:hypothetical protein
VTKLQVVLGQVMRVRQLFQPGEVLGGEHLGVHVQRAPRRLVVIRVVHPPRDCRVVVAEHGGFGLRSHDLCADVRRPTVANGVSQTVQFFGPESAQRCDARAQGRVVCVDVAEEAEPHKGNAPLGELRGVQSLAGSS